MTIIYIDWIRHALSCGNIIEGAHRYKNIPDEQITPMAKPDILDPPLTEYGIQQSIKIRNDYINKINNHHKYDLMLCSDLRRTMETAIYLFSDILKPGQQIWCIPYIAETSSLVGERGYLSNMSSSIDKLEQQIPSTKGDLSIINFDLIRHNNSSKPDYDNFLKYIIPLIADGYDIVHVAIVSHHNFIRDHFNKVHYSDNNLHKIKNLQIFSEKISYNGSSSIYLPFDISEINNHPFRYEIISSSTRTSYYLSNSGFNYAVPSNFSTNACNYNRCGENVVKYMTDNKLKVIPKCEEIQLKQIRSTYVMVFGKNNKIEYKECVDSLINNILKTPNMVILVKPTVNIARSIIIFLQSKYDYKLVQQQQNIVVLTRDMDIMVNIIRFDNVTSIELLDGENSDKICIFNTGTTNDACRGYNIILDSEGPFCRHIFI